MIKVEWDVEELVALIDIHRRLSTKSQADIDAELERLSVYLNRRADRLNIVHDEKFRNLNGMKMMYQNVVYIATGGARGMSSASSSMRKVYGLLQKDPDVFELILTEFRVRYACT